VSKNAKGPHSSRRLPRQGRGPEVVAGKSTRGTSFAVPIVLQGDRFQRFYGGGYPSSPVAPNAEVVRQLPTIFAIPVVMLGRDARQEVLADLQEWYAELAETRGIGWARIFVAGKLLSAIGGNVLNLADRVAGIVGKVWGYQKG
jgi:hypothetical protein